MYEGSLTARQSKTPVCSAPTRSLQEIEILHDLQKHVDLLAEQDALFVLLARQHRPRERERLAQFLERVLLPLGFGLRGRQLCVGELG